MATTDQLVQGASCIDSCIPSGMRDSIIIYLLATYLNMSINTDTLVQGATCVDSCIPPGMRQSVIISLLSQLVSGGGGSGGSVAIPYANYGGSPNYTPIAGTSSFIAVDSSNNRVWFYYNGQWN